MPIAASSAQKRDKGKEDNAGFSLIELLTVVSIIALCATMVVPATTSILQGSKSGTAAYEIRDAIERARAYAKIRNTWVRLVIFEEDGSGARYGASGKGRLVLGMVAAKNGRWSDFGNGAVEMLERPARLENITLDTGAGTPFQAGKLSELNGQWDASDVDFTASKIESEFSSGGIAYPASLTMQMSPRGEISIDGEGRNIPRYIRIYLAPARGSMVSASDANVAIVRASGPSGTAEVLQP